MSQFTTSPTPSAGVLTFSPTPATFGELTFQPTPSNFGVYTFQPTPSSFGTTRNPTPSSFVANVPTPMPTISTPFALTFSVTAFVLTIVLSVIIAVYFINRNSSLPKVTLPTYQPRKPTPKVERYPGETAPLLPTPNPTPLTAAPVGTAGAPAASRVNIDNMRRVLNGNSGKKVRLVTQTKGIIEVTLKSIQGTIAWETKTGNMFQGYKVTPYQAQLSGFSGVEFGKKRFSNQKAALQIPDDFCFSLVTASGDGNIDVVMKTMEERNTVAKGLYDLIVLGTSNGGNYY